MAVLDELGLVEKQPGPLDGGVVVVLDPEQAVGGDHHIDVCGHVLQGRPPAAPGLGDRDHVEVGREPAALRRPVPHDAGRRHHQIGSIGQTTLSGVAHQGQRLQRLAEPHVVGENAAEPVLVEEGQPVESGVLIRPEGGAQTGGCGMLGPVGCAGQGRAPRPPTDRPGR